MSIAAIRRITISTLSPIHVGCDEVFDPSQFVIADGMLNLLDPATLAAALDEKERQQLIKLTGERDPIGPLQQFFKTRRERLASLATQTIDVAGDIAREYEEKAGQIQARGGDGHPVYNLFPMARTAYNPLDGLSYLPGSSLKGSIRTAWLNQINKGNVPREEEKREAGKLQQRLLGYAPGKFENDPFRHLLVADAHANPVRSAPPTRISFAAGKKKRESERIPKPIPIYLEIVRETLAEAFTGELRFTGKIAWNSLCDACNGFYRPQLEAELDHPQFGPMLAREWRQTISRLLGDELQELMKARQGFLLRVGRHSGAESVTLDGVRSIKILGAQGQPTYRPNTTEKRFVSATRTAQDNLLPFGWLWVDGSNDTHQHLSRALSDTLSKLSQPIRDAHADRLAAVENRRETQRQAAAEAARRKAEAEAAARAEADAQAAREAARAQMSQNLRSVEDLIELFRAHHQKYPANKQNPNADFHNRARALVKVAHDGAGWTPEEKAAAANAIEEWLPKVVRVEIKDERKKLKLVALRSN